MHKELKAISLWLDVVEKWLNEAATEDRRLHRKTHSDGMDESNLKPRSNDNDIRCRIKVEAPTFDGVHDLKVFSNWLVDIDYYFDWYKMSKEHKILFTKMRLVGPFRI